MSREKEIEELINDAAKSNGYEKVKGKGLKTIFKNELSGDVVEVLSPELLNLKTAALSAQRFRAHVNEFVESSQLPENDI